MSSQASPNAPDLANRPTMGASVAGVVKAASGVLSAAIAGTDYLAPASIAAGTGITLTPSGGVITVAATGGGGSTGFPLLAPDGSAPAPSYSFSGHPDSGIWSNGGSLILAPASTSNIVLAGSATGNTVQFHVIPQVAGGDGVIKVGTMVGVTPYQYRIAAKNGTTNLVVESDDQVPRITVTPTGGPIFENTSSTAPVVFRQSGGAAGTNEAATYHDGTDFQVLNRLATGAGSVNVNGRVKFGASNAAATVAAIEARVTRYLGAPGYFRMYTDDGAPYAGTGLIGLTPASASGFTELEADNDTGFRLAAYSHNQGTTYGRIQIDPSGVSITNFHPGTIAGGAAVGSTLTLIGSDNASPVNAHVLLNPAGHGHVGVGTGSDLVKRRLSVRSTRYTDAGGLLAYTDDGTGYGTGTGSAYLDPATSSGLATLVMANSAGSRVEGQDATGATLYGRLQLSSAGISLSNHPTGFYGVTPVAKPTVTGSKGANAALASLLAALAALGLITDSSS